MTTLVRFDLLFSGFHQPIDAEKRGVNTYISDSDLTSDFCQSYLSAPGTKLQITPLVVKLGDDSIHNYVSINEGLLSTSSMSKFNIPMKSQHFFPRSNMLS